MQINSPSQPSDSNPISSPIPVSDKENKLTSVAKQRFSSDSGKEEIDQEMMDKIQQLILPIETNDLFHDTDLIVFKDSFKGRLPLNGILESDFKKIKEFYKNFITNDTLFKFDQKDKDFQEKLALNVKKLLTREIGRKILLQPFPFKKIVLQPGPRSLSHRGYITINLEDEDIFILDQNGEKIPTKNPGYISLGHELIHAHHGDTDSSSHENPTVSLISDTEIEQRFDNVEEQVTITGLKHPLKFSTSSENGNNLSDGFEEIVNQLNYDELNENHLRAAFSLKPRVDHQTQEAKKPDDLSNYQSKEFAAYFNEIFHKGLFPQMREILIYIDLNQPIDGVTPLAKAVSNNNQKWIKFFVDKGADIYQKDKDGNSLCHHAVRGLSNDPQTIEWLFTEGLDIDQRDNKGNTPLQWAIFFGQSKVVQFLIDHRANIHTINNEGQNLCHAAAFAEDSKTFIWLAQQGIDLNQPDFLGNTPLALALSSKRSFNEDTAIEIIAYLIDQATDLSVTDEYGNNLYHALIETGNLELMKKLVSKNVDINKANKMGLTPLKLARSKLRRAEIYQPIVDFLIANGAV